MKFSQSMMIPSTRNSCWFTRVKMLPMVLERPEEEVFVCFMVLADDALVVGWDGFCFPRITTGFD